MGESISGKEFLTARDLHALGFGRQVSQSLMGKLPSLWVGSKRCVRRKDLDIYLDGVIRRGEDLRQALGIKRTKADFPSWKH